MNEKKDKIKNAVIIILIFIIICGILFLASNSINDKDGENTNSSDVVTVATEESNNVSNDEKKELSEISYKNFADIYNGSDKKIVLIARPTCHYCQIAEPIIQNVAFKYDLTINYLNTDNLSDDDQANLVRLDDYFANYGTPSILVVQDGKIIDSLNGLTTSEKYIEFFNKEGFITK